MSSHAFRWVYDHSSCEALNRYLYVQDVWWLSDSLNAEHAIAAAALAGYFRELSKVECGFDYDGAFESMGGAATPVLKELQSFFLALHSCLDITTKLLHALAKMPDNFDSVPSNIGGKELFRKAQAKRSQTAAEGGLFEKCWETTYLEGLRDEIIHNRALDAAGVVFDLRDNGRVTERFVLLPDADERGMTRGWKNRRRLCSLGLKANELAPHLFKQISERILKGLDAAIRGISCDTALELDVESARSAVEDVTAAYLRCAKG